MPDIVDLSKQKTPTSKATPETPTGKLPIVENQTPPAPSARHHVSQVTSYCENPENVSFDTQDSDETVLIFLRRHIITNIPWIFFGIIFSLLPIFLIFFLPFPSTFSILSGTHFLLFFLLFYYLIVFSYAFICYITWFYNSSLITNQRVVDIDYSNVVFKNVAATKLNLIEDVSFAQAGILAGIFNYGDILLQTAGEIDNFEFQKAPNPSRAVNTIEELIGKGPHE